MSTLFCRPELGGGVGNESTANRNPSSRDLIIDLDDADASGNSDGMNGMPESVEIQETATVTTASTLQSEASMKAAQMVYMQEQVYLGNASSEDQIVAEIKTFCRSKLFQKFKLITTPSQMAYDGGIAKKVLKEFCKKRSNESSDAHLKRRKAWWEKYSEQVRLAVQRKRNEVMCYVKNKVKGV